MIKVGVYTRVSTQEQRERQSISTQIECIKDYCKKEGLIIFDTYRDDGVSGSIPFDLRIAGNKLLIDAKENQFKTVLVYKIDRIGRDNLVTLEAVSMLTELGINIISITEISDRSNPQGRFIFNLYANLAEWEKEQIRERTIDGKYRKARSGKFPGGVVPYGFILDVNQNLVIDDDKIPGFDITTADVIKMIFEWMILGLSTIKIAEKLNDLGIPAHNKTRKKVTTNKWRHDRIRTVIMKESYIGTYSYGRKKSRSDNSREEVILKIPKIIDETTWNKANHILVNNKKFSPRNTKLNHLLTSLIICDFCGHGYFARTSSGKKYYKCNRTVKQNSMVYGKCIGNARMIRQDWIEKIVWNQIKSWILQPDLLENTIRTKLKKLEKNNIKNESTLTKLVNSLSGKQQQKNRILDLYKKEVISDRETEEQLSIIKKEEDSLRQLIIDSKKNIIKDCTEKDVINQIREDVINYKNKILNDSLSFKEKKKIVRSLVKEIRVRLPQKPSSSDLFIETIPFKQEINLDSYDESKTVTQLYKRDKSNNTNESNNIIDDNMVNITYQFPFPPKELDVAVTALPR